VALLIFLVPATLLGHAFWQVAGTGSFIPQLINFLKNTAMIGGLLFIGATQSQPTLFPRTLRANSRERERIEGSSLKSARAS
jgi:putative oxidoreductase